jgi:hypothetical protein
VPVLFILSHPDFNNPTDGIVYGSAVGFGFGMTENLLYFIDSYYVNGSGQWIWTMIVRALFTGTLHAFSTGIVGYLIGRAKFHHLRPYKLLGKGLLIAVLIHLVWNALILNAEMLNAPQIFYLLLGCFPLGVVVMLVLMQLSLLEESLIIREELIQEAAMGLISPVELRIIPYYHRRISRGWIDPAIKREFLKCVTTLAFKKRELRYVPIAEQAAACREIGALRERLSAMRRRPAPQI